MTTALATLPLADEQDDVEERTVLADLAALGADQLAAQLERALPSSATGQVAVAAFQSSI
jgi:FXSXX-COOH protein